MSVLVFLFLSVILHPLLAIWYCIPLCCCICTLSPELFWVTYVCLSLLMFVSAVPFCTKMWQCTIVCVCVWIFVCVCVFVCLTCTVLCHFSPLTPHATAALLESPWWWIGRPSPGVAKIKGQTSFFSLILIGDIWRSCVYSVFISLWIAITERFKILTLQISSCNSVDGVQCGKDLNGTSIISRLWPDIKPGQAIKHQYMKWCGVGGELRSGVTRWWNDTGLGLWQGWHWAQRVLGQHWQVVGSLGVDWEWGLWGVMGTISLSPGSLLYLGGSLWFGGWGTRPYGAIQQSKKSFCHLVSVAHWC